MTPIPSPSLPDPSASSSVEEISNANSRKLLKRSAGAYVPPSLRPGAERPTNISASGSIPIFDESSCVTPPSSPPRKRSPDLTPARVKLLTRPLPQTPERNPYAQTTNWAVIHSSLQSIKAKINLSDIDKHKWDYDEYGSEMELKINSLQEYIDKNVTDLKEQLVVLKLLSDNIFCGIEPIFYSVLSAIKKSTPELDQYMYDILGDQYAGPLITPDGVKMIISFFQRTYGFSEEVLSSQVSRRLPALVRDLATSYQEGKVIGWAVHSESFFQVDRHIVPVFALCYAGKIHVFIFDSQGHDVYPASKKFPSRVSDSLHILRHGLDSSLADKVELYSYNMRRQSGNVECSVFTLLDLKCLIEMHSKAYENEGNLVQYFADQTGEFKPRLITPEYLGETNSKIGLPFYELSILPPAMMKPMQSIREFQTLKEKYSSPWLQYNTRRLNSRGEFYNEIQNVDELYRTVHVHTSCTDEGIKRNLYVLKKRFEYIIYMLVTVCEK